MENPSGKGNTIQSLLEHAYKEYQSVDEGVVATYIPELSKANPDHFGICVATVEGETFEVGNCDQEFTMQSISKILIYALALSLHGEKEVSRHVGVEPSGDAFNSIQLDKKNRAFNPMVNAGAITTTAFVHGATFESRWAKILDTLSAAAGRTLRMDEKSINQKVGLDIGIVL